MLDRLPFPSPGGVDFSAGSSGKNSSSNFSRKKARILVISLGAPQTASNFHNAWARGLQVHGRPRGGRALQLSAALLLVASRVRPARKYIAVMAADE